MDTHLDSVTSRIELSLLQFFSPNGLLAVVIMIVLSVLLFNGSGIERRTLDRPMVDQEQPFISPILGTVR